ncbi:MAG TPA: peptidoglycan-binding domain-containing protein [Alphaproteobacteria bacterium]|nr:peptidoglycan-binding domain-containing protein [Alphaproteobacteria bacterium]
MLRPSPKLAAAALLVAALPAAASVDTPHPTAGLHGDFTVVAHRPFDGPPTDPVPAPRPGIRFGETLTWFDGRTCPEWTVEAPEGSAVPGASDPVLSDLRIPPVGEPGMFHDHRRNQLLRFFCRGELFAELVRADDRVLYAEDPAARRYVVLERPLPRAEIRELQRLLTMAGFDAGPADGVMGPRTREAVAAYAQWRGAVRRFETGVVTENLLEGVGFSATD